MSWTITLLENTALVPLDKRDEVADFIVKNTHAYWQETDDNEPAHQNELVFWDEANPTTIQFDSDDMEGMDYITGNQAICEKLAAVGTTGRILFGSLEGDNKGQFWGVEFASGHYRSLTASVSSLNWNAGTSFPGK